MPGPMPRRARGRLTLAPAGRLLTGRSEAGLVVIVARIAIVAALSAPTIRRLVAYDNMHVCHVMPGVRAMPPVPGPSPRREGGKNRGRAALARSPWA